MWQPGSQKNREIHLLRDWSNTKVLSAGVFHVGRILFLNATNIKLLHELLKIHVFMYVYIDWPWLIYLSSGIFSFIHATIILITS